MEEPELNQNAALFDFDGTLVDSFKPRATTHKKVSILLLNRMGRHTDEGNMERMVGIVSRIDVEMHQQRIYDRNVWWKKVLKRFAGKSIDLPESTIAEVSTLYWESIKKNSTVYPGALSMLRVLKKQGVKLGLISDTDGFKGMKMERIEASGLAKMFDTIVIAGEDTIRVKPDPEPYTLAAERLQVLPRNCISVGDNPTTDVDGSLRAGIKVAIIRNEHAPQTSNPQRYYLVKRKDLASFILRALHS